MTPDPSLRWHFIFESAAYEMAGVILLYLAIRNRYSTAAGARFAALLLACCTLRFALEFLKPPFGPLAAGGLPVALYAGYDCGLCPDHMQHSCLTILEITDHCNLSCPVCYAASGPHRAERRDLATIERMLDAIVASEGEPDVVQISGGEPTTHPDFFAILDAAKRRPIKHLMLNTNGIRIAQEPGFAEKLASYAPGFEVYLQFDSLQRDALTTLRGADLRRIWEDAVAALDRVGLSTTLVMTVAKGVNDQQMGDVVEWATKHSCVRGVTLQPIQFAGRLEGVEQGTGHHTADAIHRPRCAAGRREEYNRLRTGSGAQGSGVPAVRYQSLA